MASNYSEWSLQLYNKYTNRPIDDDSGLFKVLTAADPTVVTCYSDDKGTSLTQPATIRNGWITFYTDSSTSSVDITVLTATGRAFFLEAVSPSQHRVDVDPDREFYTFKTNWHGNTACDAVADTGFDLIAGMRIDEVYINVTTNTTATSVDFGISGDTDGFLDAAVTSATGFKFGNVVLISSETSIVSLVAATQKRGALVVDFGTGFSATATVGGSRGFFSKKPYMVTAATSLVYVVKETNSEGTGEGYLSLDYVLVKDQGN